MYEVIKKANEFGLNKVFANSREFIEMIDELSNKKEEIQISELVKEVLNKSGYTKSLELEDTTQAENRLENLEEFLTVAMEFEEEAAESTLAEFLESITLSSDVDELEEERRLCYVGLTRAEDYLYLTYARQRTIFGSTSCNKISRFLEEIPKNLLEGYEETNKNTYEEKETVYEWEYGNVKKYQTKSFKDKFSQSKPEFEFRTAESFLSSLNKSKTDDNNVDLSKFRAGVTVYHKKFGEGVINSVEQEGEDLKLDINFEKVGHKRLMAKYANLEVI